MSITTEEKIEVLNETIQYFEDAFEPQDFFDEYHYLWITTYDCCP